MQLEVTPCLSPEQALALAADAAAISDAVEYAHLESCPSCRRWVMALAADGTDAPEDAGGDQVLRAGERVGRYTVERALGRGAFGEVYLARDAELDRQIALKFLRWEQAWSASTVAAFAAEARAMATLHHPHVVSVFDVGQHPVDDRSVPYLVMEHVAGGTLQAWLAGERSAPQRLTIVRQLAAGLAAVHAAGLVHRDVKPTNVLVSAGGEAKLADFGLSRLDARDGAGGRIGTPAYMAPEVQRGDTATVHSDQYSFALVAAEVLDGARPTATTPARFTGASRRAATALARALAAEPNARCASMHELVVALAPQSRRRWIGPAIINAAIAAAIVIEAVRTHVPARAQGFCAVEAGHALWESPECDAVPASSHGHCADARAALDRLRDDWNRASFALCRADTPGAPIDERTDDDRLASEFCLRRLEREAHAFAALAVRPGADWARLDVDSALATSPQRCLDAPRALPPPPIEADRAAALELAADLVATRPSDPDGLAAYDVLVSRARALAYPPLLARALDQQGVIASNRDLSRGWELLQEALRTAQRGRDEPTETSILAHIATLAATRGEAEQARAYLAQARSLAAAYPEPNRELLLARLMLEPHRIGEDELAQELASFRPQTRQTLHSAYVLGLARFDALTRAIPQAERLLASLADAPVETQIATQLAAVAAYDRIGFAPQVIAHGEEALRLLAAIGFPAYRPVVRALVSAYAAMGDDDAAARWLRSYCDPASAEHETRLGSECELLRDRARLLDDGGLAMVARRLARVVAPTAGELSLALSVASRRRDWRRLAALLPAFAARPEPSPWDQYARRYYQARLLAATASVAEARTAAADAIAFRERELPGSPGIEDDVSDAALAATLADRAGDDAGRDAALDRYQGEFGGVPHLLAEILLARIELQGGTSVANWLQQLDTAITTFTQAAPRQARALRTRWRKLAGAT